MTDEVLAVGSGGLCSGSRVTAGSPPPGVAYELDLDLRLSAGEVSPGEEGTTGQASSVLSMYECAEDEWVSSVDELTAVRLLTRNGRGTGGGGGGGGGGGEHALEGRCVRMVVVFDRLR